MEAITEFYAEELPETDDPKVKFNWLKSEKMTAKKILKESEGPHN